ncbi:hypothetical protein Btru_017469 [Bulinus truncatus]|nr:hypothetical protein Btru_017469 [Bulinus truncatus]
MEIPMLKMSQNSESASSPETKEEWHKEKKNSQRGVCMKITEADTITCDDLVHNCIINVGKLCTTTAKLENDHNYIFHRSSSRFKLIVHLQKTITDLPISCLKSITSSILDAIKDVDLLLIDLGKKEHHQDWIQTIGQDLRYKKRPAFGIIASSLIETGQKDAKYDMFKMFRTSNSDSSWSKIDHQLKRKRSLLVQHTDKPSRRQ